MITAENKTINCNEGEKKKEMVVKLIDFVTRGNIVRIFERYNFVGKSVDGGDVTNVYNSRCIVRQTVAVREQRFTVGPTGKFPDSWAGPDRVYSP